MLSAVCVHTVSWLVSPPGQLELTPVEHLCFGFPHRRAHAPLVHKGYIYKGQYLTSSMSVSNVSIIFCRPAMHKLCVKRCGLSKLSSGICGALCRKPRLLVFKATCTDVPCEPLKYLLGY